MIQNQYSILLIDDETTSSMAICTYLQAKKEFYVTWVNSAKKALEICFETKFDCIILDINMPGMNGFEFLKTLRGQGDKTQVIFATAREKEEDLIKGLELGGDDYLVKPFSMAELKARIQARIRRSTTPCGVFQFDTLKISLDHLTLENDGKIIDLSAREGKLLKLFLENPQRVLSRSQILDSVWGSDYFGTERTVDNFITSLRKKLGDFCKIQFESIRGLGYKMNIKKD